MSIWLLTWTFTCHKLVQCLNSYVCFGNYWSKYCALPDRTEIQEYRHGLGPGFFFPKQCLVRNIWNDVWALVVKGLHPTEANKNPGVSIWLPTWALTFPKSLQCLNCYACFGSWWSTCWALSDRIEIQECRHGFGHGPLLHHIDA